MIQRHTTGCWELSYPAHAFAIEQPAVLVFENSLEVLSRPGLRRTVCDHCAAAAHLADELEPDAPRAADDQPGRRSAIDSRHHDGCVCFRGDA